ncbi:MAG TPA: ATP-binding protein [Verrucomicrobiae bacterium]
MNTRSLKFRLVAWYAGWLTVLFVIFGVFVYISLDHYLKENLREALTRRARQVGEMVQRSALDWKTLGIEIPKTFAPEVNNRFTRVIANGKITYVSGAPADRSFDPQKVPVPTHEMDSGETFGRRILPDGSVMLIVVVSRPAPGGSFLVEEGESAAPIAATLHAWLAVLVLGLAVLIFGAAAGGALLVRWALKPVGHIITSAERISFHNLSERLPVADTRDELERLSEALNGMIRRLDDAFQHNQRFLADASHELRTPLAIIQGELESVVGQMNEKPEVQNTTGSALEELERLKKIVEGLFALSRLDAGEAQQESAAFDLGELAATTADQMGLLAEDKSISIRGEFSQKVVVCGDRARLKQVLVNLLDNAINYTPDGGKIDVKVTARNGKALLDVSDTGIGIPREAIPHLFERFFRVDKARSRQRGGAGLGLSIVKSICAAHNGRVNVESKEGEGSRFTVELPLAPSNLES